MSDYEPGTVALVQKNGGTWHRALYMDGVEGGKWACIHTHNCRPDDVRPLVVLDPEDREQVERLAKACPDDWCFEQDAETLADVAAQLQTALRSLASPPKPSEPTGLGAVVEDAAGRRWIRTENVPCWYASGYGVEFWDQVAVVRVLSEGVQ